MGTEARPRPRPRRGRPQRHWHDVRPLEMSFTMPAFVSIFNNSVYNLNVQVASQKLYLAFRHSAGFSFEIVLPGSGSLLN